MPRTRALFRREKPNVPRPGGPGLSLQEDMCDAAGRTLRKPTDLCG